ncbi:MAG: DNA topoisomerase I, partial [Nanoarchaeota archaeon]|nr:DNA topoisomerase I [Nanoarchaeota archaeon]
MAYTLIISEKPAAAKKIAEALADGKPIKENIFGVPYFKVTHGKKDIVVACAVGHLYALDQDKGNRAVFPVFDISWKEAGEVRKTAEFSSKYLKVIKKLAKDANEFVIATDLDIEGETIGFNILRFACRQKDGKRMRFSTLTKEELIKSFENRTPTIDWGLAKAGETRHFLDFYNGINYSRALTSAYKSTGGFKILSIGRVQGPALKTIVDKEKEIKAFIPVPYWQIELNGKAKQRDINAWHKEDKFWEKQKAETVMTKVKGQKEGIVSSVEKKSFKQQPPFPFDLTSMQVEAYKVHKIQPKDTLAIAQELYTAGYISYPRTSSQV